MFADQDYVCKLSTAMRFESDMTLQSILEKMRTPGEDRTNLILTADEWKVLQNTDIEHGASLEGTELWHQAGYPWTIVCMAQWVRSQLSAEYHKTTLFLCPAQDYIQNTLRIPVSTLADFYHPARDQARMWLFGLFFWLGCLGILAGFTLLEIEITNATQGPAQVLLTCMALLIEYAALMAWSRLPKI